MNAIVLGVLASVSLGVSDVFGRASALRSSAMSHVSTAMLVGVFVATPFAVLLESAVIRRDIVAGVLSGVLLAIGLAVVLRAMADSSSAVASPLAGVLGALIPLGWDLLSGTRLSWLAGVGAGVAIGSMALTTFNPNLKGKIRRGVGLATVAGLLFGAAIILVVDTSVDSGAWPAVAQRAAGFVAIATLARSRGLSMVLVRGVRKFGLLGGLAGGLGMVFWVLGAQCGDLGTVSVAASTYPTVTVVLAAIFDGDQLRWWQVVGVVGAVCGTALIALS
jgi:drug/metabolite transporter (DMT)-like permease